MKKVIKSLCMVMATCIALVLTSCGSSKPAKKTVVVPDNPCADCIYSTQNAIRANATGESMDQQMAKKLARTAALDELASKMSVSVKALLEDFSLRLTDNKKEELKTRTENLTRTLVDQSVAGYRTVCEKYTLTTRPDGSEYYTCYYVIELSKDDISSTLYRGLTADGDLNLDIEYERFKMELDKALKEADKD